MDIYFQYEYGLVNEYIEKGKAVIYEYKTDEGIIRNMFIKREISELIDGTRYYDIVSPYGYGGPVVLQYTGKDRDSFVKAYINDFEEYCDKEKIVSEFVRFHPVVKNYEDFEKVYHVQHDRLTVGTNLRDYDDPVQSEFSKSCRKRIRRAIRDGISYRVTRNPDSIDSFKKVYYSTMDRNQASDYYYFSDDYFNACMKHFGDNILLVEAIYEAQTIAAGFYFVWDQTIHIHLSGTLSKYLYLSPAYILRYAVTLWGKENGFEVIHHGGGRSNKEDDSLYEFKKQFGQQTSFEFCTGKKIWNKKVYAKLSGLDSAEITEDMFDGKFFPTYRER